MVDENVVVSVPASYDPLLSAVPAMTMSVLPTAGVEEKSLRLRETEFVPVFVTNPLTEGTVAGRVAACAPKRVNSMR
jgi:hypothetical protein